MFGHRIRRKRLAHCVGGCVVDAVLCSVFEDDRLAEKRDKRLVVDDIIAKSEFHFCHLAFRQMFVV